MSATTSLSDNILSSLTQICGGVADLGRPSWVALLKRGLADIGGLRLFSVSEPRDHLVGSNRSTNAVYTNGPICHGRQLPRVT